MLSSVVLLFVFVVFFFFKQKTAYEMRISDWSSDVCSSDLIEAAGGEAMSNGGSVTEYDHMVDMVARAKERWGGVHILINNAGEIGRASCRERVCQYV